LSNAMNEGGFTSDPYVLRRKCCSILCVPIVLACRLMGALYLENRLTPGVFVEVDLAMLSQATTQLILVIENSRLNRTLETLKQPEPEAADDVEGEGGQLMLTEAALGPVHMKGEVYRQTSRLLGTKWDLFFAELRKSHLLFYSDSSTKAPIGFIRIDKNIVSVQVPNSTPFFNPPTRFFFQIDFQGKRGTQYFAVADVKSAKEWMLAITAVFHKNEPKLYTRKWTVEDHKIPSDILIDASEVKIDDSEHGVIAKTAGSLIERGTWKTIGVALKTLFVVGPMGIADLESFYREVAIMRSLRHPNILLFLGAFIQSSGNPCIVTEYVGRGNLFSFLQSDDEVISVRRKLSFARQLAQGMLYMHSFDPPIIHRDLKTPNVLVTEDLTLRVADFGFARVRADSLHMTGMRGTGAWMAPEVFEGKPYTELVDVFSYGIILWEIWSRQRPYPDIQFANVLGHKVVKEKLRPPIPDDCPARWVGLMKDCWSHTPQHRPSFESVLGRITDMESSLTELMREDGGTDAAREREMEFLPALATTDGSDGRALPLDWRI